MPREYTPEIGGSIYTDAIKEAFDGIEIAMQTDIPKLRAMRNNEETRAIINDLHQHLLKIFAALITIKSIGEQHKEFRTNHQESHDAQ